MRKYFILFLLLSFSTETLSADFKESKEEISRNYLIKKLENFYQTLNNNHFSKKPITLRLAHILSLRAEDQLSRQYSKTCKNCLSLGTKDARRSLSLYKEIGRSIKGKHPALYSHSLFQMAYLYRLIGENSQSISYLKKIISLGGKDILVARAYFNLGEIYFESYKYHLSLGAFNEVLRKGKTPWEFRSYYLKVWSLYNVFSYNQSVDTLEKFLKSNLYKKGPYTELEKSLKKKLHEELVVLYSRSQVTEEQIRFFYNFNKDEKQKNTREARNQRLFDLAQDLSRIGRAGPSNRVWNVYLSKNTISLNQIKAHLSMVDNYFVIHNKGWVLKTGKIVEKLFTSQKRLAQCPKEICIRLRKQQKRYIQELHRQSKKNKELKPYLSFVYELYNASYLNEFDMLIKSAFLAEELKKYTISQDLFQKSAKSLYVKLKKSSDSKEIKNIKKDLEHVSVLQMKMANLSEDKNRKYQSYDFYLKNGQDKKIKYRARYQQAYLAYEDKKYQEASKLFRDLALLKVEKSNKKIESLALKSAHLALSSLNFLDEKDIFMAEWSGLFRKRFPNNKEFIRINHTAVFNTVKTLLDNKDFSSYPLRPSSDKDILKAWNILNSLIITRLNEKEKIKYYMNKLLLSKEFLKLKEMDKIIAQLMEMKSLSKEDYKVILTWKLWLAESRFNFSEALRLVKILKPKEVSEQHYLRLAHLAELANKDYISYYETYIKKYPNSEKNFDIIRHIIDKTLEKNKKDFLKKYISYFTKKPDTLSYLVLKLDNQELNNSFMKFFTNLSFMKDSSINKFQKRKYFVESFNKNLQKVRKFSLAPSSTRRLTQSIKSYKSLIDQLEKEAGQSVKMKDWLSQVVAFSGVHSELVRFYESILKLPLPKGLTPEEQAQYTKLIGDQMIPYRSRATVLKSEIDKLLDKDFIDKYIEAAKKEEVSHGLLKWEIAQLYMVISDQNQKTKLATILEIIKSFRQKGLPVVSQSSDRVVKDAYVNFRSEPFNKNYLLKLLDLEKSKKNDIMSYYLMNRIKRINKSKKGRVKL